MRQNSWICLNKNISACIPLTSLQKYWTPNKASMVKNDITNQMTDAVESRAAIFNDYAASAEEYMTAFALDSEVHELLQNPTNAALLKKSADLN